MPAGAAPHSARRSTRQSRTPPTAEFYSSPRPGTRGRTATYRPIIPPASAFRTSSPSRRPTGTTGCSTSPTTGAVRSSWRSRRRDRLDRPPERRRLRVHRVQRHLDGGPLRERCGGPLPVALAGRLPSAWSGTRCCAQRSRYRRSLERPPPAEGSTSPGHSLRPRPARPARSPRPRFPRVTRPRRLVSGCSGRETTTRATKGRSVSAGNARPTNAGIRYYKLFIDGKKRKTFATRGGPGGRGPRTKVHMKLRGGKHRWTVKAYDYAGNVRRAGTSTRGHARRASILYVGTVEDVRARPRPNYSRA